MFGQCIAWRHIGAKISSQLIICVKINFFLQLSADVFVLVGVWTQLSVQLRVLADWAGGSSLSLLLFFCFLCFPLFLLGLVKGVHFFTLLIELDDQIVLLSISEPNVVSLHFLLLEFIN